MVPAHLLQMATELAQCAVAHGAAVADMRT